jgi:hypothetical protein
MKKRTVKRRLYQIAAIILLVGLTCSVLIYLYAEKDEESTMITQFEQSKRYRHDLELTGGKGIVALSNFMKWFESLWKGEALAFTMAGLSIFSSLVVFLIAKTSPPDAEDEGN